MNKINFIGIIKDHFFTLKDDGCSKLSKSDVFTHLLLPAIVSFIICYIAGIMKPSVISILVNFGAITTALLMSAVIMVYDQKSKIKEKDEKEEDVSKKELNKTRITLYTELCKNTCYAILTSIVIVVLSVALSFFDEKSVTGDEKIYIFYFITFLCYYLFISTIITFLMIIKRFSVVLDT